MNKDWIDVRRAEVKQQMDNSLAVANQASGALKMLDALEAELNKPAEAPKEDVQKTAENV